IEGEKIILKNKLTQNEVYMEIDSSIETKNINILDINVHLSVRMGSREMSLKDIYQFESGTIVMMRQHTDDLVELVANNKVIAKGEIVVDGDEMGIRIKELVK
ncbi:MAG: FliM/FliN family flagellar motor switch protein, partial [Deferribacteraceae bacterium]|nr:FliM/FliN family flagellar motor switch protein [Deferribacteraceae bacterium]